MKTWVALLRGINVGRNKRIAMGDLRAVLETLGYDDVRTVLVSGNAIFQTAGSASAIERDVSAAIKREFAMEVRVLARSSAELSSIVEANPFVARRAPAQELLVSFLSAQPPASKLARLDASAFAPDEFEVGKKVIYSRLRNGVSGSTLPDWQKTLEVDVTARNWNTVSRLHDLAGTGKAT